MGIMADMRAPRLIACDVDGTLLPDGQFALAPDTVALIHALLDKGIVFVPASGRQYVNLQRVFRPFLGQIPFVAENGTIAFIGDKAVFRACMSQELGNTIVRAILEREECEALVSGARISYIQPKDPAFARFMREELHYQCQAVRDLTQLPEAYSKISAYHPHVADDAPYWRARFGDTCTVAVSGLTWIDLMPAGISKASGLAAICEHLGIAPEECLAIGDNDNDAEMFDFVAHPIAMATGSEKARAHARETTENVNDIFKRVLELELG